MDGRNNKPYSTLILKNIQHGCQAGPATYCYPSFIMYGPWTLRLIRQRTVIYPSMTHSKIYPQNTIQITP